MKSQTPFSSTKITNPSYLVKILPTDSRFQQGADFSTPNLCIYCKNPKIPPLIFSEFTDTTRIFIYGFLLYGVYAQPNFVFGSYRHNFLIFDTKLPHPLRITRKFLNAIKNQNTRDICDFTKCHCEGERGYCRKVEIRKCGSALYLSFPRKSGGGDLTFFTHIKKRVNWGESLIVSPTRLR